MINLDNFVRDCLLIREQSPLVHNLTNYVAMNVAANALLSLGASPLMSFCEEEMDDIVKISNAVVANIGCLDSRFVKAMNIAGHAAIKYGKPLVFDPVGVGASAYRMQTSLDFIRECRPQIIRGNASEIQALFQAFDGSDSACESKGVDACIDSNFVVGMAERLAEITGAVVSMSGPVDYITDGKRTECISNGDTVMRSVTAMGCTASSITGAFAAVNPDMFEAALNAMAIMGVAGQNAADIAGRATGSFACAFMDQISSSHPRDIANKITQ